MRFSVFALSGLLVTAYGCTTFPPDGGPRTVLCSGVCQVDVEAHVTAFGHCRVDSPGRHDEVVVTSPDTVIKWRLPDGFSFCVAQRDGVWFVGDTKNQFYDGWATLRDDAEHDPKRAADCKKFYRWGDRNNAEGKGRFKYEMQFRAGNAVCNLDPWVVNR